jgi:hypothetical protein
MRNSSTIGSFGGSPSAQQFRADEEEVRFGEGSKVNEDCLVEVCQWATGQDDRCGLFLMPISRSLVLTCAHNIFNHWLPTGRSQSRCALPKQRETPLCLDYHSISTEGQSGASIFPRAVGPQPLASTKETPAKRAKQQSLAALAGCLMPLRERPKHEEPTATLFGFEVTQQGLPLRISSQPPDARVAASCSK